MEIDGINADKILAKLKDRAGLSDGKQAAGKNDPLTVLQDKAMNSAPYNAPYYNEALKQIGKLRKYCQSRVNAQDSRTNILADSSKSAKYIMAQFRDGVSNQIKELKQWQRDYSNYYRDKKADYESPEVELLRRQDWDSKLHSMNKTDLGQFIQELAQPGRKPLTKYEADSLLSYAKDDPKLYANAKGYVESHHIGEEWKNSKYWQEVQQSLSILNTYQTSPFIYEKPKEGEWLSHKAINVNEIANEVLNSQFDKYGLKGKYTNKARQAVNIFEDNEDEKG